MRRLFNKYQRKMIRIISGNACASCGCKLNDLFHADHKVPFSKKGQTNLVNAQALCPDCNLKKSNKL